MSSLTNLTLKHKTSIKLFEDSLKLLEINQKQTKFNNLKQEKVKEIEKEISILKEKDLLEECIPLYKKLIYISNNKDYYLKLSDIFLLLGDLSSSMSYYKSYIESKNDKNTKQLLNDKYFQMTITKGIINIMEESKHNTTSNENKSDDEFYSENNKKSISFFNEDVIGKGDGENIIYLREIVKLKYFISLALYKAGDILQALNYLKQIVDLSHNNNNVTYTDIFNSLDESSSKSKLTFIKDDNKYLYDIYYFIGKIYLQIGNEQEGYNNLWKAYNISKIDSNHVRNKYNLEVFIYYMTIKIKDCIKEYHRNILNNKLHTAELWINKGLKYYPNHPECLIYKAIIMKEKKSSLNEIVSILELAEENLVLISKYDTINIYKSFLSKLYNELSLEIINDNVNLALSFNSKSIQLTESDKINNKESIGILYMNKGDLYLKTNNITKAVETYNQCLLNINSDSQYQSHESNIIIKECNSKIGNCYFILANRKFKKKLYTKALDYILLSEKYLINNSYLFYLKSKIFISIGDIYEAYKNIIHAIKNDCFNRIEYILYSKMIVNRLRLK